MSVANFNTALAYAKALLMLKTSFDEGSQLVYELSSLSKHKISNLKLEVLTALPLLDVTKKFLKVLFSQNKVLLLPKISEILKNEFFKKHNIKIVQIVNAKELLIEEQNAITHELKNHFKTEVKLEYSLDVNLIDGFTISYDNYFIDFSTKAKIFKIKSCILK
jgi:F0F1-type ATP synthase delta subunit